MPRYAAVSCDVIQSCMVMAHLPGCVVLLDGTTGLSLDGTSEGASLQGVAPLTPTLSQRERGILALLTG